MHPSNRGKLKRGRGDFFDSHTLQDAVLRNLQILGESAQRISPSLKEIYSEVEWRRIAAFRNVLVHNYLGIDLQKVWEIVQQDVPRLKCPVWPMLKAMESRKEE
ncbi:MAG: HepT-like ribonuclease domain-containing protein [Terriglobia bacterium]